MSTRTTQPKGRPTPARAEVARSPRFTIDPRISWTLLVLGAVAVLVAMVVLGIGDGGATHGGPLPTGGHG